MPGPAKQPYELKLLTGAARGRDSGGRKLTPPPSFRRVAPEPPSWLPAEALAEWHRVVPELLRLGLLKAEDRGTLAAYCTAWATLVKATARLEDEGLTTGTAAGGLKPHPAVAAAADASRRVVSFGAQFGLTPSSEANVGVKPDDDADDADNPFA